MQRNASWNGVFDGPAPPPQPMIRLTAWTGIRPRLDDVGIAKNYLTLSDRDLLAHAGTVSHDAALAKAESEFDKFRLKEDAKPRPVHLDFENAIQQAKLVAAARKKRRAKKGAN